MGFTALFAVAIVVAIVWGYLHEKKRRGALEAIAISMGLSFRRKQKLPSEVVSAEFYLFSLGSSLFSLGSSSIKNLMYGNPNNVNTSLFGYSYTRGGGKGRRTYTQTVALFSSESINLPNFDLRPEIVFHKIGSVFGYQDIDFESHAQFSSSYLLRGENENAIRRIFTDDVLTFFSNSPGLSVEARGNKLIYYRDAKRVNPDDMPSFLHEAKTVFDLFRGSQDRKP